MFCFDPKGLGTALYWGLHLSPESTFNPRRLLLRGDLGPYKGYTRLYWAL